MLQAFAAMARNAIVHTLDGGSIGAEPVHGHRSKSLRLALSAVAGLATDLGAQNVRAVREIRVIRLPHVALPLRFTARRYVLLHQLLLRLALSHGCGMAG